MASGVVRHIDNLGRLVIPREFTRTMGIDLGDPMEMILDGNCVIVKKYAPGCSRCDSMEIVIECKGMRFCRKCADFIGGK